MDQQEQKTFTQERTQGGTEPDSDFHHAYVSTFCIHGRHDDCRLTCKTCLAPCECFCHRRDPSQPRTPLQQVQAAARAALITAAHDYAGIRRWRLIKVRSALAAGLSIQEIADILGVARQTIGRWCRVPE